MTEDAVLEEVARALAESETARCFDDVVDAEMWDADAEDRDYYRRLAAAAVAAYRAAQDGGAEETLRRVEALCDRHADRYHESYVSIADLRAALATQAGEAS